MKKRLFSMLLVIVMILSVFPMSALAASRSVPLKLTISSYGAPFWNPSKEAHTESSIQALHYLKEDEVGSSNPTVYVTAFFKGSNEKGWSLSYTIEAGNYVKTFDANAKVFNKDMSAAGGENYTGFSFNASQGSSCYISVTGAKGLPKTYTLSYDANGGEGAPATQTATNTSDSCTFTISEAVPTKAFSEFKGWALSKEATEAQYQPAGSITIKQSETLYAVWAHVHADEDGDGYCDDGDETSCLHEKDEDGYCIVDGCQHDADCCPVKGPVDEDNDGIDDNTGECLHEKDEDGYCTIDDCEHPDECCMKKNPAPAGPSMQALRDMNLAVAVKCDKNSSHNLTFALSDERYVGMNFGKVVANDGANRKFSVEEYPWQCYVSLKNDYWFNLYKNNSSIKSVEARFATVDHVMVDGTVGFMVYGTEDGFWWCDLFTGAGNRFTLTVTHK